MPNFYLRKPEVLRKNAVTAKEKHEISKTFSRLCVSPEFLQVRGDFSAVKSQVKCQLCQDFRGDKQSSGVGALYTLEIPENISAYTKYS